MRERGAKPATTQMSCMGPEDPPTTFQRLGGALEVGGERFGDPGGPDARRGRAPERTHPLMRERGAKPATTQMSCMGPEDPPTIFSAPRQHLFEPLGVLDRIVRVVVVHQGVHPARGLLHL